MFTIKSHCTQDLFEFFFCAPSWADTDVMGPHSPATHSIKAFVLEKVKAPPTSPAAYENGHPILSAADCLARESESAPASGDMASQRERERARAREREREKRAREREYGAKKVHTAKLHEISAHKSQAAHANFNATQRKNRG